MDDENISSILDDWMDDGTAPTPLKGQVGRIICMK